MTQKTCRSAVVKRWARWFLVTAVLVSVPVGTSLAQTRGDGKTPEPPQPRRELSDAQVRALEKLGDRITDLELDENAVPSWLVGDLAAAEGEPRKAAVEAMRQLAPVFRRTDLDGFEVRTVNEDESGAAHVRLAQRYRGLEVVGSELVVHLEEKRVTGVNGRFTPDLKLRVEPKLGSRDALDAAWRGLSSEEARERSSAELVVFVTPEGVPRLAWSQKGTYTDDATGEMARDRIFVDSQGGGLLGKHALIWTAKYRQIYDGGQECLQYLYQLPGTYMFDETVSWLALYSMTDVDAKGAFYGTGRAYDFFKQVFSRDSYDGHGAPLVSSAHFKFGGSCTPNNAQWISDAAQMAYGDGDGVDFGPLATATDVTAHELTHAVTDSEADLTYEKEPGALNEAMSDILGESADAYYQSGTPDWLIGEDVYTPGMSGDALRYMNNPTLDAYSADYYPDRLYPGLCTPSSYNDRCGVHGNSGIANLAFYLMSAGGTHPQGKTSVVVPVLGIEQMRHVFYRALRDYMTPTTSFAAARKATAKAATAVFSCKTIQMGMVGGVHKGWDAVGVPNDSSMTLALLSSRLPMLAKQIQFNAIAGPNPPGPISPCVFQSSSYNVVANSGFESGNPHWKTSGSVITSASTYPGHATSPWSIPSQWKAILGGNGLASTETLFQQVTLPSVATTAKLSFWLRIDTAESGSTPKDQLTVQLRDPSGTVLATLDSFSNADATSGYGHHLIDVSAYIGQTVRVDFRATENASHQTSFVLDDVSLNVQ